MQLTARGLVMFLIAVPLIAAALLAPFWLWFGIAWLLFCIALLLADYATAGGAGNWLLTRRHDRRLSLAADNRIVIEVQHRRARRNVSVWVRDTPPRTFALTEPGPVMTGAVMPGENTTFTYTVRPPRRGDYAFGDLFLRWQSPLGLLRRDARFPASTAIQVYPNLVDVRKYDLLLRKNRLWELGLRSTPRLGAGSEFERLRDYTPDDEYRRINWKATARRGRPITMEYETERSQNICVLLDVGRMMRSPVGDIAKMDFAINAVLLLAYVATQKGDRVGLLTFADSVQTYMAPRSGRTQFRRMLEQLYAVEGQAVEPDYNVAFDYFAVRQSRRSLVLMFTDLTGSITTEALLAQMVRIRQRHLPLLVTLADPTVQKLAAQPISDSASLYERTAAEKLLAERTMTLDRLRRHGVQTLDIPADELSVAVINRYLALKERQMI
ncbi:MAG: DUF58 domain-containing protein [Anaerolineales bacterium]|nr:DUF58 domain-containing protein [Anaerolineales bacterium]